MKLKPSLKGLKNVQKEEEKAPKKPVTKKSTSKDSKYSDVYKPMFEPIRFLVKETPEKKDPTKSFKQYMELSVKRFDDDEGLPYVFLQMYQESSFYTGYLKGKSVSLPLEMLYDLIDNLSDLSDTCDKKKIM